jgi:two-component system, NarL family, sensor kinase
MPAPSTEIPDETLVRGADGPGRGSDRQTVEMVERDRLRLAGALHNSVCQTLSGLQLLTATLLQKLPAGSGALADSVDELAGLLGQASTELRGVVQWLRPPPMREEGLVVTLIECAAEISRVVPCEFQCDDRRMELDPYVAAQLYQIAHAAALAAVQRRPATRIEISLAADGPCGVRLSVWADVNFSERSGPEFEPELCNWELLRLRARAMGGKLTVDSPESGGTTVVCRVEGGGPSLSGTV